MNAFEGAAVELGSHSFGIGFCDIHHHGILLERTIVVVGSYARVVLVGKAYALVVLHDDSRCLVSLRCEFLVLYDRHNFQGIVGGCYQSDSISASVGAVVSDELCIQLRPVGIASTFYIYSIVAHTFLHLPFHVGRFQPTLRLVDEYLAFSIGEFCILALFRFLGKGDVADTTLVEVVDAGVEWFHGDVFTFDVDALERSGVVVFHVAVLQRKVCLVHTQIHRNSIDANIRVRVFWGITASIFTHCDAIDIESTRGGEGDVAILCDSSHIGHLLKGCIVERTRYRGDVLHVDATSR